MMVCDINCKIHLFYISVNRGLSGSGSQLHCCTALTDFSLVKTRSKIFKGNKASCFLVFPTVSGNSYKSHLSLPKAQFSLPT
jgi:hypothetical protein